MAEPSGSLHAVKQSLQLFNTDERTFSLVCPITCHFISFTMKGSGGVTCAYRPTDAGLCVLMEASAAYKEESSGSSGPRPVMLDPATVLFSFQLEEFPLPNKSSCGDGCLCCSAVSAETIYPGKCSSVQMVAVFVIILWWDDPFIHETSKLY